MNIGKREQIVIGVVAAIALIALLHVLVFAPNAYGLKTAKQERDETAFKIQNSRVVSSPDVITKFDSQTKKYIDELTSGIQQLKLEQREEFVVLPLEDFKDVQVEIPAGKRPEEAEKIREEAKKKKRDAAMKPKHQKQADLMMAEIERLRQFMASQRVRMTFLGQNGWRIPMELPQQMQSGLLWDQLKYVNDLKRVLDRYENKESQQYRNLKNQYEQHLRVLGLDVKYINENLRQYGEFVPLFYRLSFANLILKQIPSGREVRLNNEVLTRDIVFNALEVNMPYEVIDGVNEERLYFAYEELRNLNNMLEMAQGMLRPEGVAEVTKVVFRGYALLRQKEMTKPDDKPAAANTNPNPNNPNQKELPDDELDAADVPSAAPQGADPNQQMNPFGMFGMPGMGMPGMPGMGMPGMPGMPGMGMPGMPGMGMPGMPGMGMPGMGMHGNPNASTALSSVNRKEDEIGFALPIKITFRASNVDAFNYMYEILRDKPLAELHRLTLTSMSQRDPNNTNVEATATFLIVPKLFDTLDAVRKMIKEIEDQKKGAGPGQVARAQ